MTPGPRHHLNVVTMILCVESRQPPRNYCSRVCCPTALKHALALKTDNPDLSVYVFYRDIMTPGFWETYFTRARQGRCDFHPVYALDNEPQVSIDSEFSDSSRLHEPLLDQGHREIETDLLVLATGIVSKIDGRSFTNLWQIEVDDNGFLQGGRCQMAANGKYPAGDFRLRCGPSPRRPSPMLSPAVGPLPSRPCGCWASQHGCRSASHHGVGTDQSVHPVPPLHRCVSFRGPLGRRNRGVPCGQSGPVSRLRCMCAGECPNGAAVLEGQSKIQVLEMIDAAFMGVQP